MERKVLDVANAKRCDRCSDFYVEVEADCFDNAIRAITEMCERINNPKNYTEAKAFFSKVERHADLCPMCSKSLKKWFFGRDENDGIQEIQNKNARQNSKKQAECPQS